MPGPIKATKIRISIIVQRTTRAWLMAEAARIGVTYSDVVRSAIALYRSLSDPERTAATREEAERQDGQ